MKKKVVIQGVPKSSKKKVVIQGLPKADIGKRMAENKANRMQSAWDKDIAQYPNANVSPSQNMSGVDTEGNPISINPNNNPLLTNPLFNLKRGQFNNYQINEDNTYYSGTDPYVENPKYSDSKSVENKKGLKNKKRANWDFSNFNVYLPGLNPKYNYLTNRLLGAIGNLGNSPQKQQSPFYNPYANMYWNYAEGGYLPEYGDAGMTGTTINTGQAPSGFTWGQSYSQQAVDQMGNPANLSFNSNPNKVESPANLDYNINLGKVGPASDKNKYENFLSGANTYSKIGSIIGAGGDLAMEATGDALRFMIDERKRNEFNKMNAQIRAQAPMANVQPTTLPTSFQGDNPLATIAYGGRIKRYAADGMQIKQIGGMGEPNVEVEGEEHIQLPNGFSQEIKGKKHSEGGIPINLPSGTKIFSEKLKLTVKFIKELIEVNPEYAFLKNVSLPKSGSMSYADLAKKFETKKYVDLLNSKDADPIQITTAQLMIQQNNAFLEKLFILQEQNKISGVHGPQVQQNAQQEQQEQEAQQAQMQGEQMEQPMMKYGGYHLPKVQDGAKTTENKKLNKDEKYKISYLINKQLEEIKNKENQLRELANSNANPSRREYANIELQNIQNERETLTNLKDQVFINNSLPENYNKFFNAYLNDPSIKVELENAARQSEIEDVEKGIQRLQFMANNKSLSKEQQESFKKQLKEAQDNYKNLSSDGLVFDATSMLTPSENYNSGVTFNDFNAYSKDLAGSNNLFKSDPTLGFTIGENFSVPPQTSSQPLPQITAQPGAQPLAVQLINQQGFIPVNTIAENPRVKANYPEISYPQTTETGFKYGQPNQYDWLNWQRAIDESAANRWIDEKTDQRTGFKVPVPGMGNDLVFQQDPQTGKLIFPTGVSQSDIAKKYYGTSDPQSLVNMAYQEQSYDDALDTPQGRKALAEMWEEVGNTNLGKKLGIKVDVKGLSKLNDKDLINVLNKLRPAYIDSQLDYRKAGYITPKAIEKKRKEEQEADAMRGKTPFVPSEGSATRKGMPFNLGIGLPIPEMDSVYAGDYYKLEPQLKFLKRVRPDYNPATRAMNAMITNATDLSGVGIANRQNAYANFLGQMGDIQNQANLQNIGIERDEKFGNRAAIEQADRINLQGYQNYMDNYLKALGAKGTQQGLRKEAEKNYFANAIKEANTLDALQPAYFPGQYAQGTVGDVLQTSKYGGKVKKKIKIKPKIKK